MLEDAIRPAPSADPHGPAAARPVFLSYNSKDFALAAKLAEALRARTGREVYFAPEHLRAGGFWMPALASAVAGASGFVLLVGEQGLGPWQVQEYYAAFDRRVKQPDFPLLVALLDGQPAPGLPFIAQLHWTVSPDPVASEAVGRLADGLAGGTGRPAELWRHTAPYRGLSAMTEDDSVFFFGRDAETRAVLRSMAERPDRLPLLIGNSGVGKSSVARAGIVASLKRQAMPGERSGNGDWPHPFRESRRWAYLVVTPGTEPLRALVEPFLRLWQLDATDPAARTRRAEWVTALAAGSLGLRDLLDATEERLGGLGEGRPTGFFLYVDQGEELYARSEAGQAARFSAVLAEGLGDLRLHALMSLRADFLGALQADAPLFAAREQIDVPPLREAQMAEVVARPAAALGARFETVGLPADLARRAAEDSVRDAGALPLLSYLLDDMWTAMVARGDATLRLPAAAVELGGVLAERADAYLAEHPDAAEPLRRVLILKLATLRDDGEPTRRRAARSEFTQAEWRIVGALADHPYRLLVTATPESGEPYAEVAHEAIFRRWQGLRDWIAAEREFLVWKAGLEADRRRWSATSEAGRDDALLRGLALAEAEGWLAERPEDLAAEDRAYLGVARARQTAERRSRARWRNGIVAVLAALVVVLAGIAWWGEEQRREAERQTLSSERRAREAIEGRVLASNTLLFAVRNYYSIARGLLDRKDYVFAIQLCDLAFAVIDEISAKMSRDLSDHEIAITRMEMFSIWGDVLDAQGDKNEAVKKHLSSFEAMKAALILHPELISNASIGFYSLERVVFIEDERGGRVFACSYAISGRDLLLSYKVSAHFDLDKQLTWFKAAIEEECEVPNR